MHAPTMNASAQASSTRSLPVIAIAVGDPAGIGPEIALKAALSAETLALCHPVLVGDRGVIETHARLCGITAPLVSVQQARDAVPAGTLALLERQQLPPGQLQLGQIQAAHGLSAIDSARAAVQAGLDGAVDAVISAPQTEAAIHAAGIDFDGYPTFVARCAGIAPEDAFLMICYDRDGVEVRILHVTLHVSLRRAIELVTRERVAKAIGVAHDTLRRIGIAQPRIAVSGLNPHAGEGGLFGSEESEIVLPAMADARARGILVEGPWGADTMFAKPGFDAYVVMFHDQGHIVAKTEARNRSAGLSLGSPVLFSSVAHGSALDIAGKNQASPAAIIAAVRRLAATRV